MPLELRQVKRSVYCMTYVPAYDEPHLWLWLGWRNTHYVMRFAYELVDRELAKLDRFGRRPSKSRRWRGVGIRSRHVKTIRSVMKFLRNAHARAADNAMRLSNMRNSRPRPESVEMVSELKDVFWAHLLTGPDAYGARIADQLYQRLTIPEKDLTEVHLQYRLNDLTNGRGSQIHDVDVGYACLAACEIGHWDIARDIALSALVHDDEHTLGEIPETKQTHSRI